VGIPAVPVMRPLSSERRRIFQRPVLTHDNYRLMRHYVMDLDRTVNANLMIGMVGAPSLTPLAT